MIDRLVWFAGRFVVARPVADWVFGDDFGAAVWM
jgi:hypothetical protein